MEFFVSLCIYVYGVRSRGKESRCIGLSFVSSCIGMCML